MFKSYTQLPFVDEKAKMNASYYVTVELLTKKLRKVWFVISEYSERDCMFTWKSEL